MDHPLKIFIQTFLRLDQKNSAEETLRELDPLQEIAHESIFPKTTLMKVAPQTITKATSQTVSQAAPLMGKKSTPKHSPSTPIPLDHFKIPKEYESQNLKDQKVLKALMEFHQSHAPHLGARSMIRKISPSESFSSMEIPIIEAVPKKNSLTRKSVRPTRPILKKK